MGSINTPEILIFKPTYDEFKDFDKYIQFIEQKEAHKAGIAKIIPPAEWIPRKTSYDDEDIMNLVIPAPLSLRINGKNGVYKQYSSKIKPMTVAEYKKEAFIFKYPYHTWYDVENVYWDKITDRGAIYGANVLGSVIDKEVNVWNINKLGSILDYICEDYGISIDGVNSSYIHFGMWMASFAWHVEDMDLYSINYLHCGSPKTWYAIPPEYGRRFEKLAAKLYPTEASECPGFLRHKMFVISPEILQENSIPFNRILQEQGEIIITFPYSYHTSFNHGFNIAESTNFASPRWVEYGKRVIQCICQNNCVMFSMDTFVQKLQPERYKLWIKGADVGTHPEDPSYSYPAPMPSKKDILCSKNNMGMPKLIKGFKKQLSPRQAQSTLKISLEEINPDDFKDEQLLSNLQEKMI